MRVERLGQRDFAFGLTWLEVPSGLKAAKVIADAVDSTTDIRHVVQRADGIVLTGYGATPSKLKHPVYSYAAALAASGRDGIYVAPTTQGDYWFAVVREGIVVAGTDAFGPADDIRHHARTMQETFGLPLYAAPGVPMEELQFDPCEAIAGVTQLLPLRPLHEPIKTLGAVVLAIGVLGTLGYWGFSSVQPHQVTPEEIQQQAEQAWIATVAGRVGSLPDSASWALDVLDRVMGHYPTTLGGYVAEGVSCSVQACKLRYAHASQAVHAISPLRAYFGADAVSLPDQGGFVEATLPVRTRSLPIHAETLRQIPPAKILQGDWTGLLPLHLARGQVDGGVSIEPLSGVPPGFPALIWETVAVKGTAVVDRADLHQAVQYGVQGGYVPVKVSWSNGWGVVPAAWRIEFVRLSRS